MERHERQEACAGRFLTNSDRSDETLISDAETTVIWRYGARDWRSELTSILASIPHTVCSVTGTPGQDNLHRDIRPGFLQPATSMRTMCGSHMIDIWLERCIQSGEAQLCSGFEKEGTPDGVSGTILVNPFDLPDWREAKRKGRQKDSTTWRAAHPNPSGMALIAKP